MDEISPGKSRSCIRQRRIPLRLELAFEPEIIGAVISKLTTIDVAVDAEEGGKV